MDPMLRALLQPACITFSLARWPNGSWQISSLTYGSSDPYREMMWADCNRDRMRAVRTQLYDHGASNVAFAILRPTWEEIEELDLERR